MKLQTHVPLTKSPEPIRYDSRLLLLGSCFATNMGKRFRYYKFDVVQNPFGILFHPQAIRNLVHRAFHHKWYESSELFEYNESWYSYEAHSELSRPTAEALQNALNDALAKTFNVLQGCTHIVITLGTAWVYRNKVSGDIVANCHKVPQRTFSKELLSIEEISSFLEALIREVREVNPRVRFIFTISPVRHQKDGFVGNQRSKAHLISALHRVLEIFPDMGHAYFPAYEIMMDELRDYRFYETDMLHPNTLAVDYIWNAFREAWIGKEAHPIMADVADIRKALEHKPSNPGSRSYKEFRLALDAKMASLMKRQPTIKFHQ